MGYLHEAPNLPEGLPKTDQAHDPEVLARASEVLNRDRQVFLASTAEQAIDIVDRLGRGLSVVLVDMDLPGAHDLIKKLHDANPELLFIAIDGAAKASILDATRRLGVVGALKKPITPAWKPVVESIRARRFTS